MDVTSKSSFSVNLVLIITAIFAIFMLGLIIGSIFATENKPDHIPSDDIVRKITDLPITKQNTVSICSGPGNLPNVPAPSYHRISKKSLCKTGLSSSSPPFSIVEHPIMKSHRVRSIKEAISTNHWLSNIFHNPPKLFNFYPYYGYIDESSFIFSTPQSNCSDKGCTGYQTSSGQTGYSDVFFEVGAKLPIKISTYEGHPISCDILDVDALIGTVAWQFKNYHTDQINGFTIPLAKGSPYVTIILNNISIYCECDFQFTIRKVNSLTYIIKPNTIADGGYLLILSKIASVTSSKNVFQISKINGVARIAYFSDIAQQQILMKYSQVYPIESTIDTTSELINSTNQWSINTNFTWTCRDFSNKLTTENLLMIALPHQNFSSTLYQSDLYENPLIGPYKFVVTSENQWNLIDSVQNFTLNYPRLKSKTALETVWKKEIVNVSQNVPTETVNWCKWLGSLSTLVLIGQSINSDVTPYLEIIKKQLELIKHGKIGAGNIFNYDKTWNGIIGILGLNNCLGNSDDGNAYYVSHLGQYGYIVLAYAVAGFNDPNFIRHNKEMALLFAREICNPFEKDSSFPLWRNKDWYFGYSISSGLESGQIHGKNSFNSGELVLGYYACFLLSQVYNQPVLTNWSISMLASEISSLQTYFQFASSNKISVDPSFVQGTITVRGDDYYAYTVLDGDPIFPQRNASMIIPLLKPLTLMSFQYISDGWALFIHPWISHALSQNPIEPESLAYGLVIQSINQSSNKQELVDLILSKSDIFLPYGSTWTSVLYWILSN